MSPKRRNHETVSVVVTNYNKDSALLRALQSVKSQSEAPVDLIVVDDCSTNPETQEILKKLSSSESGIRLLSTPHNLGAAGAKNFGIKRATGTIIMLLDADDELPSQAVTSVRQCFEAHPEVDVVFGDYEWFDEPPSKSSIRSGASISNCEGQLDIRKLAKDWQLLGTSPFRKSFFTGMGGFDESHPRTDDIDFFRRAFTLGHPARYVPEIIYRYHRDLSENNQGIDSVDLSLSWFRNIEFYVLALHPLEFKGIFVRKTARFLSRLAIQKTKDFLRFDRGEKGVPGSFR